MQPRFTLPALFLWSCLPLAAEPAAEPPAPDSVSAAPIRTMPPDVLEFESCIRLIRDERSAAELAPRVQVIVPRLQKLLRGQVWQNPEEALVLAQILNSAFHLLLTDPPCYGSAELAASLNELLSLFTGEQ